MSVTIFLNKEKTAYQVIRPTSQFNGDWLGLVNSVTMGNYYSFNVN